MKIKLEKIEELPNARHPGNIEVGYVKEGEMIDYPKVGRAFWVGYGWRTSTVTEIVDKNTFKTLNSTYRWTWLETEKK
jgi:hypothetical protein